MIKNFFYDSLKWEKLRNLAISNCTECVKCGSKNYLTVHHKNYKNFGGYEKLDDLEVLCAGCHKLIHKVEEDYWINLIRTINRIEWKQNNKSDFGAKAFSSPAIKPVPLEKQLLKIYDALKERLLAQGMEFIIIHDCGQCPHSKFIDYFKYECTRKGKFGCYSGRDDYIY